MPPKKSKIKSKDTKCTREHVNSDLDKLLMNREVCLVLRDPILETEREVHGVYRGIFRFRGVCNYRIAIDELSDDQRLTLRRHHYHEEDVKDIVIEGGYKP